MVEKHAADWHSCPTRLIRDSASTLDAFEHKKIAQAIAQMITEERGGCAVALAGSWGSGKSTVVKLLEDMLRVEQPNVKVFIFDAWSHQGDPLRRTFLETIIDWATSCRLLDKSSTDWDKVKLQLSKRFEISKTTTNPTLGGWGIAGAAALLITPAALQIYQKVHHEWHPWWEALALVLSFSPALIALLAYFFWRGNPRGSFSSFFVPYSTTEAESETSKSADPTSVEFEGHYRKLMGQILGNQDRRVLLVIDNLDRVSNDDAKSIWSTLRVFFDPALQSSVSWNDRVWVLVPFDPDGVTRIWDNNGLSDAQETGEHFLEKTFVATFQVPSVILSDWEEFMVRQLEIALPEHNREEFNTVFRLFDCMLKLESKPPTPRNIKIFINTLGALHRQWQDRIPLAEQALYVLLSATRRKTLPEEFRKLGEQRIIPDTLSSLLSPEWEQNVVALCFNVDPSIAFQVLLSQPIMSALNKGDGKEMALLESHPAFRRELERVLEKSYSGFSEVTARALALNSSALADLAGKDVALYDPLVRASRSVAAWGNLDDAIISGITTLIEMTPKGSATNHFATSLARSLTFVAGATGEALVRKWLDAVDAVLPKLAERDAPGLAKAFSIPGTPEQFLAALEEARKRPKTALLLRFFRPQAGSAATLASLGDQVASGSWTESRLENLRALLATDASWNLKALAQRLEERLSQILQANAAQVPNGLACIVQSLFFLARKSEEAKAAFTRTAKSDAILGAYFWLTANHPEAAAECAVAALSFGANLDRQDNAGYAPQTLPYRIQ